MKLRAEDASLEMINEKMVSVEKAFLAVHILSLPFFKYSSINILKESVMLFNIYVYPSGFVRK